MLPQASPQPKPYRDLPDPCNANTVWDAIDPATLTPLQRVGVDAIMADLDLLDAKLIECLRLVASIADTQRETAFPYDVVAALDFHGSVLSLVPKVREEFEERFKRVLRPWWEASYQRRQVAQAAIAELRDAG